MRSARGILLSIVVGACSGGAPAGGVGEAPRPPVPDPWAQVTLAEVDGQPVASYVAGAFELPVSEAAERIPRAPIVVVTPGAIGFAGKEVVRLVDGVLPPGEVDNHLIVKLYDVLEPMSARSWEVVVFADRRVRFDLLIDLLYTAGRASAIDYAIAVRRASDPAGTTTGALRFTPPQYSAGAGGDDAEDEVPRRTHPDGLFRTNDFVFGVMFTADGAEVGRIQHTSEVELLARVTRAGGWGPVLPLARTYAAQITGEDLPKLVVGAHPEVTLEWLVAGLSALSGGADCGLHPNNAESRPRCLFVRRIVTGGATSLWRLGAL